MAFDFVANEKKWQDEWGKARLFEADPDPSRRKFFITFPYPYLNGSMHVGHSYSFFRTDVFARFKRMQGFNVLFPQGFHATGEPIMGTVERLRNGDAAQIENFRRAGATDINIESFKKGPEFVAKFWMAAWIRDLRAAGAAIDWRRSFITTDLTPQYSRFIEWQYNTLKKKGYVVQGTHPVIWCPHDNSPTGDHDRYVGEGESPIEYTIIKFEAEFDGAKIILPCATLRPETLYGVTNIWLSPEGKYVKAAVDGKIWLLSQEAAKKISDQQHKVEILGEIDAKGFFGKKCTNPLLSSPIPILPATFVKPEHSTGVVMGVPGHAPYDYIALEDLRKNRREVEKYSLSPSDLEALRPISLISVPGYGDFPAIEECHRLGVVSQSQITALEEATSNVYKHEFHKGKLKPVYGEFSGLAVSDCKDKIIAKFNALGISSSMWESTGEVVCRCMTKCHVKILENQWFLKFSDPNWKSAVKEHVKSMAVYPEEARLQMENTIDWLQNKACARKGGLGTKLPWDKEWKVETLSDSTIYMAYYALAKAINGNGIPAEQLTDSVFDHIFLDAGDLDGVSKTSGLPSQTISDMKREFEYFYPVDLRNSGKDLLQNHLLFFLFHHAAIFRNKHIPLGISVNGYVTVEGEKMSKSKGNFLPVFQMLQEHGADLVRLNIVAAGENLDDADWRVEGLKTFRRNLEFLLEVAGKLSENSLNGAEMGRAECLLQSRIESFVKIASENMERLCFRSAVHQAFFQSTDALRKYLAAREAKSHAGLVRQALEKIVLMACPFTPHFSEEIWVLMGGKGFCASAAYPLSDSSKISRILEEEEKYLENVDADIRRILGLTGTRPASIRLFVAQGWKKALFALCLQRAEKEGKFNLPALIKMAMADEKFRPYAKSIPGFIALIGKSVNYYKSGDSLELDEYALLTGNKLSLGKRFECAVEVFLAEEAKEHDPEGKAAKSLPFKPAIFVVKE